MAKRLLAPKEYASEWLLNTAEGDVGSWSGLDESGDIPPQPRHFEGFPPALDPASAGTQLHWCEYSVRNLANGLQGTFANAAVQSATGG
jgi:hypothetical protein